MPRMRTSLVLVAFAFLTGCSAKGDLEKICNAEQLSGAAGVADASEKANKIAAYLQANIKSSEGKNVFNALGMTAADQRGAVLKQAAKEVGYEGPCPMADAK
jgi:hypothetical protein